MPDALLELASLATRHDNPDRALGRMLEIIAADLGAESGFVSLLNPDSGRLEVEAEFNSPTRGERTSITPGDEFPGRSVFHGLAFLEGRRMAAPVMSADGKAVGFVCLEPPKARAYTKHDLSRLAALAIEGSRSLQVLWQLSHLRIKARQLETLLGAGQALVSKIEEKELFHALTLSGRHLLQAEACALYLHDAGPSVLRFAAGSGLDRPSPDQWPIDSCLMAAPIRTGKPVAYPDVESPEFFDLSDIPRGLNLRSALAAPLSADGGILGVLVIFLGRIHRFDNDERRLGEGLANLGAVALQNARLYSRLFASEEALRRNERLTMLGLVSAEIAHEIRNPVTVLKLLCGGLGADFAEGDPRRTDLRIISEKLDQLEAIVTRVLHFGRAPAALHSRCSLGEIVDDTLILIRLKLAQARIALRYEAPPAAALVNGHKGQLQQALLNLLLNAIEAMPDGGEITLQSRIDAGPAGPVATLLVGDAGAGIPEEIQGRLFDSFLSGRPEGTGLGLAVAKRIIAAHHGDIALLRTGPAGTTFRITLPLAR